LTVTHQNRPLALQCGRWPLRLAVPLVALLSLVVANPADAQAVKIAQPAVITITPDVRAKATNIFSERCATCHGPQGRGDGPAAANLKPRPIDFHNQLWQKSVTDDTMTKAIVFGGRAVGKSGQMAANPDLANEPDIVAALVDKIRRWGK